MKKCSKCRKIFEWKRPPNRPGPAPATCDQCRAPSPKPFETGVIPPPGFGPMRRLRARDIVYLPGDGADAVYFLSAGEIRLAYYEAEGKQLDVPACEPGDIFGELEVLLGTTRRAGAIVGAGGAIVRSMSRSDFLAWIERSAPARGRLMREIARQAVASSQLAANIAYGSVSERLEDLFVRLCQGETRRFKLTHDEIARRIGASRETVTRLLGRLIELGIVTNLDHRISVLRPDLLRSAQ